LDVATAFSFFTRDFRDIDDRRRTFPFGRTPVFPDAEPQSFDEFIPFILALPVKYAALIGSTVRNLLTDSTYLVEGISFSLSLLFILISHEMGITSLAGSIVSTQHCLFYSDTADDWPGGNVSEPSSRSVRQCRREKPFSISALPGRSRDLLL
jgi:hypothetical protein